MKLTWLPEARGDIERLYSFLLDKDPAAAARMIRAVRTGAAKLRDFPRLGRRMDDTTRRRELSIPFGAGAYVLRYRARDDEVIVIRVWHSREERL